MKLETERLILIPLSLNDLSQAIKDRRKMARILNLNPTVEDLDEMMLNIYKIKISNIERDPLNYQFYTYWQIILKQNNRIIGEIGYKGMPKENGQVEVGYGTDNEYQSKGYMAEALNELIRWTYLQNKVNVKSIIASTSKENIPSHKVLIKVGMEKYNEDDEYYYWKINNDMYQRN